MIAIQDLTDRAPRVLPDGESVSLGKKSVTWIDAPHVPHGWDNGFLFESTSRTLLSGDLFTQAGADHPPVTESEILGPSEAMRQAMDYYAHAPTTRSTLERLATLEPMLLASMHGSAYRGDGAALLRALAAAVS
jgi:flavorubredoxin